MTDITFPAMGTDVRLIGEGVDRARAWLERYEAALSRFRPDSELSRLNADPRPRVPASALLRTAIRAALWAARRSGGLVDPTLGDAIVRAGYRDSFASQEPDTGESPQCPARTGPASPSHAWRRVSVTGDAVRRPPGVVLDTGGTGKGLAADQLAWMIGGTADCGGDVRVIGRRDVQVLHPLTRECCQVLRITDGAVATSGIDRRAWDTADGPAHHLLDPSTGRPAWTGIVSATALAPSALEAEALAKAALLSGSARPLTHGGVLVHDDGDVEVVRP
jgi:thiamine biosynthesis lipoprotein